MTTHIRSRPKSKEGDGSKRPTGLPKSRQRNDPLLDQSIEESFPASDASSSVLPGSLAAAEASDDDAAFVNEGNKPSARQS